MMNDPYAYTQQPLPRKSMPPHLQPSGLYSPVSSTYHTHSRSASSSSQQQFPMAPPTINYPPSSQGHAAQYAAQRGPATVYTSRRTPSTNTFVSTNSSGQKPYSYDGQSPVPSRQTSTDIRRSSSSRSGTSTAPTSYVALMRKQKATVWCDRAQHEDPRLLASQRAAKVRAERELANDKGASNLGGKSGRTQTMQTSSLVGGGKVSAKIRHHGKAGLSSYNASLGENWGVGVGGVPMRLSATEVEGDESDNEDAGGAGTGNRRSGSGRSSLSARRRAEQARYRQSGVPSQAGRESGRWSRDGTPPSNSPSISGQNSIKEVPETLTPLAPLPPSTSTIQRRPTDSRSIGSGSSQERADAVPDLDAARVASNSLLGGMKSAKVARKPSTRNPEELRRRGSVDERTATMTLGAGRLYIANPDNDSD